jgi:hypothetical protein
VLPQYRRRPSPAAKAVMEAAVILVEAIFIRLHGGLHDTLPRP